MPARVRIGDSYPIANASDYGNGTASVGTVLTSVGEDIPPVWQPSNGTLVRVYQYSTYVAFTPELAEDWIDIGTAQLNLGAMAASPHQETLVSIASIDCTVTGEGNYQAALRTVVQESGGAWTPVAGSSTGKQYIPNFNACVQQILSNARFDPTAGATSLSLKLQLLEGWSSGTPVNVTRITWDVMRFTT